MSKHPIDIITNALHGAECGCGKPGTVSEDLAQVAARALTDDVIVDNAVQALLADVEERGYESPLGGTISGHDPARLAEVARIVLASVGGR